MQHFFTKNTEIEETLTKAKNELIQDSYYCQSEQALRRSFVRKVLGITFTQLILTALVVILATNSATLSLFITNNPIILKGVTLAAICCVLALGKYSELSNKFPANYAILIIFTILESYLVCGICVKIEDSNTIISALVATVVIASILFLYSLFSKSDMEIMSGVICASLGSLLTFWIIESMIENTMINYFISLVSVWVTSIYIVYDLKLILGDDSKKKLNLDNYIGGSMMLYCDFVRLFASILKLTDYSKKKN